MQVENVNNNTNFKAHIAKDPKKLYLKLRKIGNSENSYKLKNDLKNILPGRPLQILSRTNASVSHYHAWDTLILDKISNKRHIFTTSMEEPYWDSLLQSIIDFYSNGRKTKAGVQLKLDFKGW